MTDQTQNNFPIHAYLSYRCKESRDISARERLEGICKQNEITLQYDKKCLENGDSLIEFMGDLSAARFVFLFLSPEYFQSAYTLYELIHINEQADLDNRYVIPLRLTEDTNIDSWTIAKQYFDENVLVRNNLAKLLSVEEDKAAIWKRLDDAWETIALTDFNKLSVSLDHDDANTKLNELVKEIGQTIQTVIAISENELIDQLIQEITLILEQKNIDLPKLRRELNMELNAKEASIAETLVKSGSVNDSLVKLHRVIEAQKTQLSTRSKKWNNIFYDAVQLLGFLLLRSVNPQWWFHNEIHLKPSDKANISSRVTVTDCGYIEVIMAREAIQPAQFSLNETGGVKHGKNRDQNNAGMDATLLFDGASKEAIDEVLLIALYKDLFSNPPDVPKKWEELLHGIQKRAENQFELRQSKLIYYLVTHDYLEILTQRDWFPDFQARLAPHLKFICFDITAQSSDGTGCSLERQSKLLDKVALFLSLNK